MFSVNCFDWCVYATVFVCYRKLKGVSDWAREESGPRPGLPDTGQNAKHLALILMQIHVRAQNTRVHTYIQTHTPLYLLAPLC